MSKRVRLLFIALLVSSVAITLAVWVVPTDEPTVEDAIPVETLTQEATRGLDEDPDARRTFAVRRLRNPETGTIPEHIRKREREFARTLPEKRRKATSWQRRGPSNVGGRSRALAYDVSDPTGQTILAGGVSGGMWRTTDGGSTWNRTFDPGQRPSVTGIAQDPRSGRQDVWYVASGEYYGNSASGGGGAYYRGDGVYQSTDGGQTWTLLASPSGSATQYDSNWDYTHAIAVDPTAATSGSDGTDSEVYAATIGGVYRTIDGGSSWSFVLGGGSATWTDVEVTPSGNAYAALSSDGTENGLFTSATGASGSWTEITPSGWPSSSFTRTVISVNPSNENEVWFLTTASGSGPNGHELWMYDSNTGVWTDSTEYLPERGGTSGTFNSQGGYDLILDVHPENGDILYVGGRNLWRLDVSASSSDGNTWIGGYTADNTTYADYDAAGNGDKHHPDQHALAFHPTKPDTLLAGSDGGVHVTHDNRAGSSGTTGDQAVEWIDINNGYFTTQFYAVCQFPSTADPTESGLIAGGMQDNGTWANSPTTASSGWVEQLGADGGYCSLANNATDNGHSRYVSIQGGRTFRLTFDENHVPIGGTEVTPGSASGQLFINPYTLDPSDRDVMYYPAGANLWRNNSLETSGVWEEMTGAALSSGSITALGVSETNAPNVLYFGSSVGSVFRLDNANSASKTATPTDVTGGDFPGGYVSSIAVDPTDSDKVMVVFSNYGVESLFYTSDGGSSWSKVQGNLGSVADNNASPSARSAAILPQTDGTTYYVGTSVGLYSTTTLDGASTTWTQEGASEIGDVVVDYVDARRADGRVIVGTHANGTFSITNPIPVELAAFDATVEGSSVRLTWTTASETNNAGFEVQHRRENRSFEQIGFVNGHGTTTRTQTYAFTVDDELTPGHHTFRLRQLDTDGRTTYSDQQEVVLSPSGAYSLTKASPNPFQSDTRLTLTVAEGQSVEANVYNAVGQHVRTILDETVAANRSVDLRLDGAQLGSGLYVVQVEGESFEATRKAMLVK